MSSRARRVVAWAVFALALVGALRAWALHRPLPERLNTPGSTVLLWRDQTVAHALLSPDDKWRMPVPLAEIDPDYVRAVVAIEDSRFWWHPGVDPLAVVRAAGQDLWARSVVSGASTLSMQVARLAEPRPRTLLAKVAEGATALQLEQQRTKDEILELYLSLVPYGGNVEGVEAASLLFFGHRANDLSAAEIATLVAIPQNPGRRAPSAAHREALRGSRDAIARRLAGLGLLPGADQEAALQAVLATPVPERLGRLPQSAPHAARWLAASAAAGARLQSTLDRGIQRQAESVVAARVDEARAHGVGSASVVVVEHGSGEIRALVGGFDFYAAQDGAQIPSFATGRSPGSALKPFLYATALERGVRLPEELVLDVPVRYGAYSPDNYDGTFSGMVSFRTALSRSLNVPFVEALEDVGVERFLGLLRDGGVQSLDARPGHYGLSAIIGGLEVTPLELAGLYAALAEGGRGRPLTALEDAPRGVGPPLFDAGSAWLTRRALRDRDRPDFPARRQLAGTPAAIHWKTGTSYGKKDAWSAGSGERYTAVVWFGNPDRRGSSWLVGADAAAPAFFDLMVALGEDQPSDDPPPEGLERVDVCALSGRLPSAACEHTKTAWVPRGTGGGATCDLHRVIRVDPTTGRRVLPRCAGARPLEARKAVVWPTSVLGWIEPGQATSLPPLAPGCDVLDMALLAPSIESPQAGSVALLVPGLLPEHQEVALRAQASGAEVAWFVDGEFVGRAAPSEAVWWTPTRGAHVVVVQDEAGRSARGQFAVR